MHLNNKILIMFIWIDYESYTETNRFSRTVSLSLCPGWQIGNQWQTWLSHPKDWFLYRTISRHVSLRQWNAIHDCDGGSWLYLLVRSRQRSSVCSWWLSHGWTLTVLVGMNPMSFLLLQRASGEPERGDFGLSFFVSKYWQWIETTCQKELPPLLEHTWVSMTRKSKSVWSPWRQL